LQLAHRKGAAIEPLNADGLEVLTPAPLQKALGWPELARLAFGTNRTEGAIVIGLEGDWLDRFGVLLGDEGRWCERELSPSHRRRPVSQNGTKLLPGHPAIGGRGVVRRRRQRHLDASAQAHRRRIAQLRG
jgi:hypothetical protein